MCDSNYGMEGVFFVLRGVHVLLHETSLSMLTASCCTPLDLVLTVSRPNLTCRCLQKHMSLGPIQPPLRSTGTRLEDEEWKRRSKRPQKSTPSCYNWSPIAVVAVECGQIIGSGSAALPDLVLRCCGHTPAELAHISITNSAAHVHGSPTIYLT
jgi:hypothetical protein